MQRPHRSLSYLGNERIQVVGKYAFSFRAQILKRFMCIHTVPQCQPHRKGKGLNICWSFHKFICICTTDRCKRQTSTTDRARVSNEDLSKIRFLAKTYLRFSSKTYFMEHPNFLVEDLTKTSNRFLKKLPPELWFSGKPI